MVSCLEDIVDVVGSSTLTAVNIPQLVGQEDGEVIVKHSDWHFGIGHVYKTWHAASPCPPNSASDYVSQGGSSPSSPAPARYARCRDGSPGPTTLAEATPPFCASTPVPRTSVSSPFLRRMPPSSLWNWARVQNLARGVALSPKLGGDCVSQAGPAPAAQHLHGMRGVEMARGPHHLGESSRNARGTDTSAGQQSRAATAAHILKLDRYRED
ncbi:hypothetical protein G5714_014755 [Onychostoma macrolepis]|uniref:Uncharacterized protein n=1 Tax=Onychostoma macrolepis TaxID=369639 RepID=A0A7J6C8Y0_9TELE|nr:hypothetical protein G5714_014755 [Onychostoma macrolepis]